MVACGMRRRASRRIANRAAILSKRGEACRRQAHSLPHM
jgi:hypothetical protein